MESEQREERGSGRSLNVVHTLPRSMSSVPGFLTGPLERTDPAAGAMQLLVVTSDAENAVALAEAVLRMTGPGGVELFPVTTARRAARLMAGRPVLACAGSSADIRDLIRGSHLKLDGVRSVVLAWADEILEGAAGEIEALESIMGELPRDAARIVVTSRSEGRVNAFAERYLRRAHREPAPALSDEAAPVDLQYVTVSAFGRSAALRRLLDDLDPPSAAVVVASDEAEAEALRALRSLGYKGDTAAVRVARGEVAASTNTVIFFEPPTDRTHLDKVVSASPVNVLALAQPREVGSLRRIAGGNVRPFTLHAAGDAARELEVAIRRELSMVLEAGLPAREVLALEPLLERHDGIEIAAAALRLLERERAIRRGIEAKVQAKPEQARAGQARSEKPRDRAGDARPPRDSSHPPRFSRPPRGNRS